MMAPRLTIMFPQSKEAIVIPKMPKSVNTVLNSEEAVPVSPFCCSNRTLMLKGRITAPVMDMATIQTRKI